jgi:hypothetical protein
LAWLLAALTLLLAAPRPSLAVSCADRCPNSICEPDIGENCLSCPDDCLGSQTGDPPGCDSDGVCEPHLAEDCVTCPADCNKKTTGPPSGQFCCGASGQGCTNPQCNQSGFLCSGPFCCGDGDGEGPLDCASSLCTLFNACQNTGIRCDCGNPRCDEGQAVDLTMTCAPDTVTVRPYECGTAPASMTRSLLRLAVRCLDSTSPPGQEREAQYADAHGFGFSAGVFDAADSLTFPVLDCAPGDYVAAAHWTLNTTEVQTQCSGGGPAVLECFPAEAVETEDLANRFRVYSAVQPQVSLSGGVDCLTGNDVSRLEVRSDSLDRAYQGVLAGRYLCKRSDQFAACNDSGGTGPSGCSAGQCGLVTGFNLAPQSYRNIAINEDETFDICCDYEVTGEAGRNCEGQPSTCSPLDMQCASAVVLGVCRPRGTACDQAGASFQLLDRVVWQGPAADVNPGDSGQSPTSIPDPCFQFSTEGTFVAGENRFDKFTFGPAVPPADFDDGCQVNPSIDTYRDDDLDGVYDECDFVQRNAAPADGVQTIRLRSGFRNQGFSFDFNPATASVTFDNGVAALQGTVVAGQSDADNLTVVVPGTALLAAQEIFVLQPQPPPEAAVFGFAAQDFVPRWYGYVADGTPDGVLGFDTAAASVVRTNTSRSNAYVNLNCNPADAVAGVGSPRALAVRPVESTDVPGVFADREVFAVSDVTLSPAGSESRLFGFRVADHRLLATTSGVPLPGPASALDLAEDDIPEMGDWHAYVAWTAEPNFGKITRVNVDDPNSPTWGSSVSTNFFVTGEPMGIRARYSSAGQNVYAYVTSVSCHEGSGANGPLGPPPTCKEEPCGPGPTPPERALFVTVMRVTDPADSWVEVMHKISGTEPPCSQRPPLANFGLSFNGDGSLLFIANPDKDRVDVLRTSDFQFDAFIQLPAGSVPVDVALVEPGGTQPERAYVAGYGDGIVRIIDVDTRSLFPAFIDLNPGGPPLAPVAIAARTDGLRLFTVNSTDRSVSVLDIKPASPTENKWRKDLHTASDATRLVLLRLP